MLKVGNFISQPSVFLRRRLLDTFGYLDELLHFGMDYEYWLRIGRAYPAHFVPDVRVRIIRARTTKTESGGIPRLYEADAIGLRYGATELRAGMHHEWAVAFTDSLLDNLRKGQWGAAAADFRQIWRYPSTLPRSFAKVFIRKFVPRSLETRLRQTFVRPNS